MKENQNFGEVELNDKSKHFRASKWGVPIALGKFMAINVLEKEAKNK